MHRLLRSQVSQHLGAEPPEELSRLLREVDERYRAADEDRESLRRALELLSDLSRRQAAPAPATVLPRRDGELARSTLRLFQDVPFPAFLCDAALAVTGWNAAAERAFGWSAGEAVGRDVAALLFAEAERTAARRELLAILPRTEPEQALRVAAARSGAARLDEWTLVPLRDAAGRPAGLAALLREPFATPDRYVAAWQGTGDGIFDWDLANDRLWVSDTWLALAGAQTATGKPADWLERIHPSDREAVQATIKGHLDGETPRLECEHRLRGGGGWRWVLVRGRAVRDAGGKPLRLAGAMMDVTERRNAADRALHDALHDPLTRLPNRAFFLDLVRRSFARARRREGYGFALIFLDLDQFKAVNDGLGHAAGDELLMQLARRLETCLREGDMLARHGGDEFTILLDDVRGPAEAQGVADRIHQATAVPFTVSGREVFATASIGVALSSPSYARPEDLLLDADTAMYRAKAQGRARTVLFDSGMRERAPQLLDLEADLRRALQRSEFRVQYLPVVDVASGHIQGLEALVRWAHPQHGLIAPGRFVPLAEETGLIVPIGRWLLQQAGRDLRRCRRAGGERLMLHVNLSAKQLLDAELLDHIDGVLEEEQLDPTDLAVEVTEQVLDQGEAAAGRLTQLRDRGVRLYMDDFGSGRASLASLHRFDLDSLKIDRSLFDGGGPFGMAPQLVRSILSVARELGKPVVAEGVETAEQFCFLRELGCSAAQGFYFSPPVECDVARSMVERRASW